MAVGRYENRIGGPWIGLKPQALRRQVGKSVVSSHAYRHTPPPLTGCKAQRASSCMDGWLRGFGGCWRVFLSKAMSRTDGALCSWLTLMGVVSEEGRQAWLAARQLPGGKRMGVWPDGESCLQDQ